MHPKTFNIENNYTLEDIKNIHKSAKKIYFYNLVLSFLLCIGFFFSGVILNNYEVMYSEIILFFSLASFIYFASLMISTNSNKYCFQRNDKFLDKEKCPKLLDWAEEFYEIKDYVKNVNKQCRQLTNYEYMGIRDSILYLEEKREKEFQRKACHKLYNEL